MSSKFTVDLDQLDQVVARLTGLAGFLTEHLDQLDHKIQALPEGSWKSAAATAYKDAHTRWLAAACEFTDGVSTAADAAQKAHGRYTDAVATNYRMLRSGQA
ncbi:WXG100 family type VII secretion target [Nocardia vaccinii]|uniref:WXG100 family type VII secretion target n=1 Tax=Nocardia vaccinii TaxID=1822 RepID=UPI000834C89B|nr:WXG100 family type VII secretion target [Nocardia vaccinii]